MTSSLPSPIQSSTEDVLICRCSYMPEYSANGQAIPPTPAVQARINSSPAARLCRSRHPHLSPALERINVSTCLRTSHDCLRFIFRVWMGLCFNCIIIILEMTEVSSGRRRKGRVVRKSKCGAEICGERTFDARTLLIVFMHVMTDDAGRMKLWSDRRFRGLVVHTATKRQPTLLG